jgi:hypothetical protein
MGGPQQSAVMSDAAALALIGAHDAVTKTIQTEAAAETRAEETVVPEEHGGQYHGLWKAIPYESTPSPNTVASIYRIAMLRGSLCASEFEAHTPVAGQERSSSPGPKACRATQSSQIHWHQNQQGSRPIPSCVLFGIVYGADPEFYNRWSGGCPWRSLEGPAGEPRV